MWNFNVWCYLLESYFGKDFLVLRLYILMLLGFEICMFLNFVIIYNVNMCIVLKCVYFIIGNGLKVEIILFG